MVPIVATVKGATSISESITLDLPDDLVQRLRSLATATDRRFEEVVLDSLRVAVEEPPIETFSDEEILALSDATLDPDKQELLSDLLAGHREGALSAQEEASLDRLMETYRRGLVLKARALKVAVSRGLHPRLADDAA
jgi:predicted transcriptional regulator